MMYKVITAVIVFHWHLLVLLASISLYFHKLQPAISDDSYVERPELEEEIKRALNYKESFTVLVYGEKGGGKTTLMKQCLKNRRGVVHFDLDSMTTEEAKSDFLNGIVERISIKGTNNSEYFLGAVFAWCIVQPVIIIAVASKCSGDTLARVTTLARILSYDKKDKRHARIVVDVSGSRSVVEAGLRAEKERIYYVHVGSFSEKEAEAFIEPRLPAIFTDQRRRSQIAGSIASKFDCIPTTLDKVCDYLAQVKVDTAVVDANIVGLFENEKERALLGYTIFQQKFERQTETTLNPDTWIKIFKLLLKGSVKATKVCEMLKDGIVEAKASSVVTHLDIALANLNSPYHPLRIDPFDVMISLSGKVVKAALKDILKDNV